MRNYYILVLLFVTLAFSCVREPETGNRGGERQSTTVFMKTITRETASTRAVKNDADISSAYILLFDGKEDASLLLDWNKALPQQNGAYSVDIRKHGDACYAVVIANSEDEIKSQKDSWGESTTLKDVRENLKINTLQQTGGIISALPARHPMHGVYELTDGINATTTIGTMETPVELIRATAKVTVTYSGKGGDFALIGANVGNAPVNGFVFPDVNGSAGVAAIPVANYGMGGDIEQMLSGINPEVSNATFPLYLYESPKDNETFVIVKGSYKGTEGYYRINLLTEDKTEQLPVLRNYYYRITITRAMRPGYSTAQEAIDNPAENGLQATIEVSDPYSHEIISDGKHFLGVTNSELWIYDSYVMNEFHVNSMTYSSSDKTSNYESPLWGNGFLATTVTYTTDAGWELGKVTADNGIRFRKSNAEWNVITDELLLDAAIDAPVSRDVIITIPHDLVQGTVTIKVGTLEKKILIKRDDVISVMGDVIDLGTGFSSGEIDYIYKFYPKKDFTNEGEKPLPQSWIYSYDLTQFSTSPDVITGGVSDESGIPASKIFPNEGQNVYLHVKAAEADDVKSITKPIYGKMPWGLSEFYLTRVNNQARIKVHMLREGFGNEAKDVGVPFNTDNSYQHAFWRNDQTGERLITVSFRYYITTRWSARVIYGEDFIRLAKSHRDMTTEEIINSDAEDFQADDTWKTFLQQDFQPTADELAVRLGNPPNFRIALTSKNTTGKPRYGAILVQAPYCASSIGKNTSAFWIYVRQGEEADYVMRPTDQIDGKLCTYAQQVSPFNLTVADPAQHGGGSNYTDHKSMNGRGVFVDYPSQVGYIYQFGSDIAFNPTNPISTGNLNGYKYDYNAPYQELCPEGYTLPPVDFTALALNTNSFWHSFVNQISIGGTYSYCADGYFDRKNYPSNDPNAIPSYLGIPWMQDQPMIRTSYDSDLGGATALYGYTFVNPITLANVFMPCSIGRTISSTTRSIGGNPIRGVMTWGSFVDKTSTPKSEPVFSFGQTAYDRSSALHIRCVKE